MLEKIVCKNKFWKKNFRKKILKKSFEKKNYFKKILKKKCWKKLSTKKILEKSLNNKKFWNNKLQKKKKIITKIYSNIYKCHTIFALLAPFDRTGQKTGSNENVCGIWFKIGSVARSHWTQVMWRFERSREQRYNHGLRAVGNSLTTWAVSTSSVVRKILVRACLHDEAAEHSVPQKSWMLCISCRTVLIIVSLWC